MIERIEDMPAGTIGFRATGSVTGDEYRDTLLPPMRDVAEAGDVRMVFVAGPAFEKFEPRALLEDTKTGSPSGWDISRLGSALPW